MPKPANIIITYRDDKTSEGQTIINIPTQDDLTLGEMIAMANHHAFDMNQLSDAEIIRCSISIDVSPLDVDPGAQPGSDLEIGADFTFKADNGFTSQIRIPAFRPEFFIAGSPDVDLSIEQVSDFVTNMIDGYGTDNDIPPSDYADVTTSRGEDLTSLLSARKSIVKSRV